MTKSVLITGCSSGIGRAATRLFAKNGWNVVATLRAPETESELTRLGQILVTRLDVQDPASITAAIEAGLARFGKIDALVNNAGYSHFGVFEAASSEQVRQQFDVNVFGVMEVTRALLPHFRRQGGGTIINVSSRAGLVGLPLISLYCASKFALEGFSEALSYELASQNIIVKIVEPSGGVTNTSFSERMARERSSEAALKDYESFVTGANAVFAGMQAKRRTSADEVAQVIYDAATDGATRLRYFCGEDVGNFVQARQTMPDGDFLHFMRSRFGLPSNQAAAP